jgi:hypothetical protein
MEGPPIDCKGGSKANPTHPGSSWHVANRELISLINKSLFSTNLFFASKGQLSEED